MTKLDNAMHSIAKIDAPGSSSKKPRRMAIARKVKKTDVFVTTFVSKKTATIDLHKALPTGSQNPSIFTVVRCNLWDQTVFVRQGLSSKTIVEMCDALAMPRASFLDYLQLPRSTIEARIKNNTPLTPTEGDAVLRSAKALARAQEVFEDSHAASSWLKREIRSLGGVTPVSLMDTDSGFELVMHTLGRIEHGVVA